jgi:SH3-like domain-containing protein
MAAKGARAPLGALLLAGATLVLWHPLPAQEAAQEATGSAPAAVAPDQPGAGRSTGLPLPRFVSLGAARVNLRFGPGREYPISWVLAREGLPVEIIAEFDTWRKVRLHDADEGWIHASLLSGRRTILVTDTVGELRRTPDEGARVVLRAEPGVVGELVDCATAWCQVDIEGRRGWLRRDAFWGTLPGETPG